MSLKEGTFLGEKFSNFAFGYIIYEVGGGWERFVLQDSLSAFYRCDMKLTVSFKQESTCLTYVQAV